MKNIKNVLIITSITNFSQVIQTAERPPQPPKMQTFGQMIKHAAEEKQKKERAAQPLEYARRITPASLQGLPADLQRAILLIIGKSGSALNIYELANSILSLARTDKALRIALNNPGNLIAIFNALPYTANAIALFKALEQQPGTMPAVKKPEIIAWITKAKEKLEAGQELYNAVAENNLEIVADFLKNKNLDLNWQNHNSLVYEPKTALGLALHRGNTEIVNLLLAAGPNIDNIFYSFLGATGVGNVDYIHRFVVFKKFVNIKDSTGRTALFYASENGRPQMVHILLDAGAKVDTQDNDGTTALMHAAQNRCEAVVRLLLDAKAKINLQDKSGMTALMYAAQRGRINIVTTLVDAGADTLLKNNLGQTVNSLAMVGHHFGIVSILVDAYLRRR